MDNVQWKYLISYIVWLAFELVIIYFFFPETAGRTLEELAFCMFLPLLTSFFLLCFVAFANSSLFQCSRTGPLPTRLPWPLRSRSTTMQSTPRSSLLRGLFRQRKSQLNSVPKILKYLSPLPATISDRDFRLSQCGGLNCMTYFWVK